MDFGGGVALDGLAMSCSDNNSNNAFFPFTSNGDPKWYGSGNGLKQERSSAPTEDECWRDLKMTKTSTTPADAASFLRSNYSTHSDGQHDNMLSFSSSTMPTYYPNHTSSSPAYARNTGYGSTGGLNMHGVLSKGGPFTPSQWMELEHQALICKYLTANAPIPSNLLLPIRKALESFPGSHLRHNPYGWGAFQLGFSGSTDPEPGRCRRTDGKKWRCSRDAVVDQKYCERHMNRGRHRSRKPVEGQTGQCASTTAKLMPMSSSAAANGGLSQLSRSSSMQCGAPNLPASSQLDRGFLSKGNLNDKIQGNQYSILKHNPSQESSRSEFGLVCSDSLLNPLHDSTSLINSRNYTSSKDLNDPETKSQNSLRQFMDNWPHSDRTQLSISIPMTTTTSSDFMSSTSSPTNEKLALSPLRLSRELDPTQMGLGMGTIINEPNQRQANWIPISWETSMGGPLGEVLHAGESKNASPLHLMSDGWDNSPRMALSPTGVLQKTNSSAGSSPRNENNLLGTSIMNSSSLPAM